MSHHRFKVILALVFLAQSHDSRGGQVWTRHFQDAFPAGSGAWPFAGQEGQAGVGETNTDLASHVMEQTQTKDEVVTTKGDLFTHVGPLCHLLVVTTVDPSCDGKINYSINIFSRVAIHNFLKKLFTFIFNIYFPECLQLTIFKFKFIIN